MGKSEVDSMRSGRFTIGPVGAKPRNFCMGESNSIGNKNAKEKLKMQQKNPVKTNGVSLPPNMELFSNQVAGHMQDGVNMGELLVLLRDYKYLK